MRDIILGIGRQARKIRLIDDAVHSMPSVLAWYRGLIKQGSTYQEWMDKGIYHVRYPSTLIIATTTHCNLDCYICGHGDGYKGSNLTWDNFIKLTPAMKHAKTIILTGWGESLMWPHLEAAVEYIGKLHHEPVIHIVTNGTLLSRTWAKTLSGKIQSMQISLNASTPGIYNRDMRHGDWDKTVWHIREFMSGLSTEDRKRITISYVAHANNLEDIPAFPAVVKSLGASTAIIQQYLVHTIDGLSKTLWNVKREYNAAVKAAIASGERLGVKISARMFFGVHIKQEPCTAFFDQAAISIQGEVSPCCQGGNISMGNAFKDGFGAVWFGSEYYRARTQGLDICRTCSVHCSFDSTAAHTTAYCKEA